MVVRQRQAEDIGAPPRLRARFASDERAAAAVEFALVLPVLLLMFLSMLDGAFALRQQFRLDHVLRAGTEAAKSDPGTPVVEAEMAAIAAADTRLTGIEIATPVRYCLCPEAPAVPPNLAPSCTATCAGGVSPGAAYALSAELPYTGLLAPAAPMFTLSSTLTIQVR